MNINESPKEFRLKSGSKILNYINRFSVTEKTVFGIFVIIACFTTLLMIINISDHFMVEVPAKGGEIREGVVGLPHMINPVLAITDIDRDISSLVYSGLMKYDGDKLVTDLAESYKISEDGLKYNFILKEGIYFHDGIALTTEDVAFTINKIQNIALKSPRRVDWNNISVNIISPKEIQFVLKQPYSPFITNTTIGIIPKHIWNNLNDDQFVFSQYNIEPIGSGPFKVKSIIRDNDGIPKEYKISAFKDYYGNKNYLDSITFVFFADNDKSVASLENGMIDSLASVSASEAEKLKKLEHLSVLSTPLPRIFGIFFNQNNNPVLTDKNVRKALSIAINRDEIIDSALDGYAESIYGPLPTEMIGTSNENEKQDLELARTILEKSGWTKNSSTGIYEKKGPKSTLQILSIDLATSDTPDLKQTAEIIKKAWTAIGVKVEIKIFESGELYQNIIRPRKYDTLLFGQLIGKDRDIFAFWHSSQRNSPGLNVSMYTNSKADSILETIRTTEDEQIRKTKYIELNSIIKNDIPAIFLYSPDFIYVLPKQLKNNRDNFKLKNITVPSDRWNSINNWHINTEKVWKIFAK